jgi:hypothetical protein
MSIVLTPKASLSLRGTMATGNLLSAEWSVTDLAEGSSASYQWWIGSSKLIGATQPTLWLDDKLLGQSLVLRVAYTDSTGQAQLLVSAPSSTIVAGQAETATYSWRGQVYFWKQLPARTGELPVTKGHALLSQVQASDPSSMEKLTQTPSDGAFYLSNVVATTAALTLKKNVTVTPNSTTLLADVKSALTLSDVLDALKIYLRKPVTEPSPYKLIAADINQDGQVSLSDVLGLLKIYLGKSTTDLPRWVFVDEAASLVGVSPTHTQVPVSLVTDHPGKLMQNFAAILVGDVNGSWQPPPTQAYQVLDANHFTSETVGLVGVSASTLLSQFGIN